MAGLELTLRDVKNADRLCMKTKDTMTKWPAKCGFSQSFTQGFSPSFTHPRVSILSFYQFPSFMAITHA
jgi:hypothetical protein